MKLAAGALLECSQLNLGVRANEHTRVVALLLLASVVATLVAALAFSMRAEGRGIGLLLVVVFLLFAPHAYPRLGRWLSGSRRPLIGIAVLILAGLALFWPTPLFVVDYMEAVQP